MVIIVNIIIMNLVICGNYENSRLVDLKVRKLK